MKLCVSKPGFCQIQSHQDTRYVVCRVAQEAGVPTVSTLTGRNKNEIFIPM